MDHIIPGNIPQTEQEFIRYIQQPVDIETDAVDTPPSIIPTDTVDVQTTRLGRLKRLKNAWNVGNIKTYMTLESMRDEFWEGYNTAESVSDKVGLITTTVVAIGGQAYERARAPETLAASVATNAFKETIEHGHSTATGTLAGSVLVGGFVYAQQKIIGRNMLRTVNHFPKTYDTAKDLWPKAIDVVDDTLPGIDKPVQQGVAMVSVGTTPFVMTARANNPEISMDELKDIERKVTRRGSIASAGAGVIVLGSLSLAPHIPDSVTIPIQNSMLNPLAMTRLKIPIPESFADQMVDKSQLVIDTLSSPTKMIALLTAATLLGKVKGLFTREKALSDEVK